MAVLGRCAETLEAARGHLARGMGRSRAWLGTGEGKRFAALLTLALAIRLALSPYPGFFHDLRDYATWGVAFDQHRASFYALTPSANYLPFGIEVCGAVVALYTALAHLLGAQAVYSVFQSPLLSALLKLPAILADLGLTAVIYWLARGRLGERGALLFAAAYALSPMVLLVGAVWGQMDALITLCLLLALLCALRRQGLVAGALVAVGALTKPQPIIFAPLLLVYLWRWSGARECARYLAGMLGAGIVICLPFLPHAASELASAHANVNASITKLATHYALNLWWVVGRPGLGASSLSSAPRPWENSLLASQRVLGPLTISNVGTALFACCFVVALARIWRSDAPGALFASAGLVGFAFFELAMAQHERYIYPAMVFLLVAAIYQRGSLRWFAVTSALGFVNIVSTLALYGTTGAPGLNLTGLYDLLFFSTHWWAMYVVALLSVGAFAALVVGFARETLALPGTVGTRGLSAELAGAAKG